MEHWKRKQMRLNYRWDLTGFEEEEVSGLGTCAPAPPPPPRVPPPAPTLLLLGGSRGSPGPKAQARLLPACLSVPIPAV